MSSFKSKIENGGSLVVWRFPCRIWHLRKQPIELQNSENSYGLILVLLRFWAIEYYLATIIFDGFFFRNLHRMFRRGASKWAKMSMRSRAGNGWPWSAMSGNGRPGLAMAGRGQPWPAMAGHGFACGGHVLFKLAKAA